MMAPDGSKLRSVTEVDNWHTLHNKVYVLCSYARAHTHTRKFSTCHVFLSFLEYVHCGQRHKKALSCLENYS
jgi:hypothetical protein